MILEQNENWSSVLKDIGIYTANLQLLNIPEKEIRWSKADLFGRCQYINFEEYFNFNLHKPLQMFVRTTKIKRETFLHIEPKNLKTVRLIKKTRLGYSGNIIENKIPQAPREIKVIIKISQIVNTEEDGECRNYPFGKYQTFGDCDLEFLQNITKNHYNITPFWVVESFENVSIPSIYVHRNWSGFGDLIDGTRESPCYPPCLTNKVRFHLYVVVKNKQKISLKVKLI